MGRGVPSPLSPHKRTCLRQKTDRKAKGRQGREPGSEDMAGGPGPGQRAHSRLHHPVCEPQRPLGYLVKLTEASFCLPLKHGHNTTA